MTLSIESPKPLDVNLQALVGSDTDFNSRLKYLNEATQKHEKALADLNLGKAAKAAFEEGERYKTEMARAQAALTEELEKSHKLHEKNLAKWREDSLKENAVLLENARQKMQQAESFYAQATAKLNDASTMHAKAKAECETMLKNATARILAAESLIGK